MKAKDLIVLGIVGAVAYYAYTKTSMSVTRKSVSTTTGALGPSIWGSQTDPFAYSQAMADMASGYSNDSWSDSQAMADALTKAYYG